MLSLEIPRSTSLGLYENLLHTSRTLPRTWPPSSTPKSVASEKKRRGWTHEREEKYPTRPPEASRSWGVGGWTETENKQSSVWADGGDRKAVDWEVGTLSSNPSLSSGEQSLCFLGILIKGLYVLVRGWFLVWEQVSSGQICIFLARPTRVKMRRELRFTRAGNISLRHSGVWDRDCKLNTLKPNSLNWPHTERLP